MNAANTSKRVLRNFGVVLRGRGIAALLTLGATVLMAKALPANQFGLVILLQLQLDHIDICRIQT